MISRESREYWEHCRQGGKGVRFGDGGAFDLAGLRQCMATRNEPADKSVTCRRLQVDHIPCEWVAAPGADPDVRLLYLHGGDSGQVHVFQIRGLPESREAIAHMAEFMRLHLKS